MGGDMMNHVTHVEWHVTNSHSSQTGQTPGGWIWSENLALPLPFRLKKKKYDWNPLSSNQIRAYLLRSRPDLIQWVMGKTSFGCLQPVPN